MSETRKPRLHHYFPQFHLKYFAVADSKLWVYDKRDRVLPNPKPISIGAIAAEAHLYDDDAPEEGLQGVEEWLAHSVDGPASTALRKVVARESITADEREALGRYVMSRDLRTPATRDRIMTQAQAAIEADYDRRVSDAAAVRLEILADSGVSITQEEIRQLSQIYRPVVTKGFWLEFMQEQTVKALPRLLAKGWTLIHADSDCDFITSDIGIVKHWGAWDRPAAPAPGWSNNANGWLMPLSPELMLAMAPRLMPQEKLATRAYVDSFNRAIADQAREFVFAATESAIRRAFDAI